MRNKSINKIVLIFLSLVFFTSCEIKEQNSYNLSSPNQLVDFVHPLMGTDSKYSLSNGNTYPAIATPWGMNFWTPMTSKMGDGWTYKYNENKIRGIKQTHQPSPWINDYAAFSIMAVTGKLKFNDAFPFGENPNLELSPLRSSLAQTLLPFALVYSAPKIPLSSCHPNGDASLLAGSVTICLEPWLGLSAGNAKTLELEPSTKSELGAVTTALKSN